MSKPTKGFCLSMKYWARARAMTDLPTPPFAADEIDGAHMCVFVLLAVGADPGRLKGAVGARTMRVGFASSRNYPRVARSATIPALRMPGFPLALRVTTLRARPVCAP